MSLDAPPHTHLEINLELINDAPDITQPISETIHDLADELVLVRAALDEGALVVPVDLVEQGADLYFLALEMEGGEGVIAGFEAECGLEDRFCVLFACVGAVEEGD
jgi:hypothetical protein